MSISDEDMNNAMERIALTPDGELLYRWLQKQLQRVASAPHEGALFMLEGRRTLAHDLMLRMESGIDERGRRTSTDKLSEQPVTFARPHPVPVRLARGAGRRISPDDTDTGYDTPRGVERTGTDPKV